MAIIDINDIQICLPVLHAYMNHFAGPSYKEVFQIYKVIPMHLKHVNAAVLLWRQLQQQMCLMVQSA